MSGCDTDGDVEKILEEELDEQYDPTDKEIQDYAEWLGIDAEADPDLLWIAKRGLKTPLPKPWKPCESGDGGIFYFNSDSGESTWDHPCDEQLRKLYKQEKTKKENGQPTLTDPKIHKKEKKEKKSRKGVPPVAPPPPPSVAPLVGIGGANRAADPLLSAPKLPNGGGNAALGPLGPLGPLPSLNLPRSGGVPPLAPVSSPTVGETSSGQAPSDGDLPGKKLAIPKLDDLFDVPLRLGSDGEPSASEDAAPRHRGGGVMPASLSGTSETLGSGQGSAPAVEEEEVVECDSIEELQVEKLEEVSDDAVQAFDDGNDSGDASPVPPMLRLRDRRERAKSADRSGGGSTIGGGDEGGEGKTASPTAAAGEQADTKKGPGPLLAALKLSPLQKAAAPPVTPSAAATAAGSGVVSAFSSPSVSLEEDTVTAAVTPNSKAAGRLAAESDDEDILAAVGVGESLESSPIDPRSFARDDGGLEELLDVEELQDEEEVSDVLEAANTSGGSSRGAKASNVATFSVSGRASKHSNGASADASCTSPTEGGARGTSPNSSLIRDGESASRKECGIRGANVAGGSAAATAAAVAAAKAAAQERETLRQELAEVRESGAKERSALREIQAERDELRASTRDLTGAADEAIRRRSAEERRAREADSECAKLRNRLKDLEAEMSTKRDTEEEIRRLRSERQADMSTKRDTEEEVRRLRSERQAYADAAAGLRAEAAAAQAFAAEIRRAKEQASDDLAQERARATREAENALEHGEEAKTLRAAVERLKAEAQRFKAEAEEQKAAAASSAAAAAAASAAAASFSTSPRRSTRESRRAAKKGSMVDVDSPSPPTPQLASILVAELRPEESKEQLSLWSQMEEQPVKDREEMKTWQSENCSRGANAATSGSTTGGTGDRNASGSSNGAPHIGIGSIGSACRSRSGVVSDEAVCVGSGSLELSSLSAVLETSQDECPEIADGISANSSLMEELRPPSKDAVAARSQGGPKSGVSGSGGGAASSCGSSAATAAQTSTERLRAELAAMSEECQRLREAAAASEAANEQLRTRMMEECMAAARQAFQAPADFSQRLRSSAGGTSMSQQLPSAIAVVPSNATTPGPSPPPTLEGSALASGLTTVRAHGQHWDEAQRLPSRDPRVAAAVAATATVATTPANQQVSVFGNDNNTVRMHGCPWDEVERARPRDGSPRGSRAAPSHQASSVRCPLNESLEFREREAQELRDVLRAHQYNENTGLARVVEHSPSHEAINAAGDRYARFAHQAAQAEVERLSREGVRLREDISTGERLLQDARSSLQREQSMHAATRAAVREYQREALTLKGKLEGKDAEVERTVAEVQRTNAELADREVEIHQIRLQLQAREAELGQARTQRRTQTQASDAALQRQRFELGEKEQVLQDRERLLDEREQITGEVEIMVSKKRRELLAEKQRAELAGLRLTAAELGAQLAKPPPSAAGHRRPRGVESRADGGSSARAHFAGTGGGSSRRSSSANVRGTTCRGVVQRSSSADAKAGGSRRRSGEERGALPSSDDSFSPQAPLPLQATPSSPSTNLSLHEVKDCTEALSEDPQEVCGEGVGGRASGRDEPMRMDLAYLMSKPVKELAEVLRQRRRDLRDKHADLEDQRRSWRNEARQFRKNYGGNPHDTGVTGLPENLAEARCSLDTRAHALNKSISDHRALEQLLASWQHGNAWNVGAWSPLAEKGSSPPQRTTSSGSARRSSNAQTRSHSAGAITSASASAPGVSPRFQGSTYGCTVSDSAMGNVTPASWAAPGQRNLPRRHRRQQSSG
eukprot:TRINITY_DN6916_c0_g1_i1.p1 TRINITY_DN6916_c0_g1~~TRINITY_DN6916_c0_g1_i1.p1  ORF type:complete len:1818 (+),score=426.28 TRINITY_DN6916_c0_g1_i1:87-5456(+)